MFDEQLKKRIFSTYKFSNHNINKFTLLLRVYPYEYMDDYEKFSETSLPVKEDFYNHLNIEDIAEADNTHTKWVCTDFEIKSLGECHHLYIQSYILLLTDAFENFWNICLEIY